MLQLAMAPVKGWEDIADSTDDGRRTLSAGLMPLLGLAAASAFMELVYGLRPSMSGIVISAIVTFAKYLLTYFIAIALLAAYLPRITADGLVDRERVALFAAYSVGMMAIIGILENLLPMELALLQFLPVYVMVVMCQGRKFLDVADSYIWRLVACTTVAVIVPVYLMDKLLQSAM